MSTSTRKHKIVIGIDFGTTYSGVAWADTSFPNPEVTPIRQWPGATGRQDMDKVPSEMIYTGPGPAGFKWGFQVSDARQTGKLLQYMKLLLDPSQEKQGNGKVPLADPLGLAQMKAALPAGKQPVDVVTEYLKCIKDHALGELSRSYGTEFWKAVPIEYHLTIPAVWSEAAKTLTLQAADRAGIGSKNELVLIAEPEAAALYCLTDMYKDLLKVGDTFVVTDCGGGTVDLVSYKILERTPNLKVKEVAVGGGLCGSVFLNRRFESFVRRRVGAAIVDEMIRRDRPYTKMMKDFDERLKRTFRDSADQELMDCDLGNAVRDDVQKGVEDGYLEITRDEMRGVFDPVIKEILRLVREQIDTVSSSGQGRVSTVLLVGGFGSSAYLQKCLGDHINANYQGISVLQPPNAWSAVVRGAVVCGLQTVQIQSRQARRSYGVKCTRQWQAGNPAKYKIWCPFKERFDCLNRISWYVKKGDEVSETTEIALPFHQLFNSGSDTPLKTTCVMLASDSARDNLEENAVHHNVYTLCTLTTDLSRIRNRLLRSTSSKGVSYYDVHFELVMRIHSAQFTFELRYNGVTYGDVITAAFA